MGAKYILPWKKHSGLRKATPCLPPKEDAGIASPEEIFIIGGESIYRQALPAARKLYLTIVDKEPEQADTFFPAIDSSAWEVTEKEMRNENGLPFSFLTYIRK